MAKVTQDVEESRDIQEMHISQEVASPQVEGRACGKLYLTGEYAVVDGAGAVISAVNKEINGRIISASDSERSDAISVAWGADALSNMRVPAFATHNELRYVKAASYVASRYLYEDAILVSHNDCIALDSQLVENDGRKFGLGSSGAVTVATIQTMIHAYGNARTNVSRETVYKLSVLALLIVGDNGSFGDVACSSFGQMVYYIRPSQEFSQQLIARIEKTSIHDVVNLPWDQLEITALTWPHDILAFIGWTGTPASSYDLVNAVHAYKTDCAQQYQEFVESSARISHDMKDACEHGNAQDFVDAYHRASELISLFSRETGDFAETKQLREFKEIARKYGCEAKFSGAGGGDCGIAIARKSQVHSDAIEKMIDEWKKSGIEIMPWELR
ncbi:phosphomevalonate kinase [Alloscardovia theropitheci]|nr:phosphomevalonate kinase [Alloscardovia theropitheci]